MEYKNVMDCIGKLSRQNKDQYNHIKELNDELDEARKKSKEYKRKYISAKTQIAKDNEKYSDIK